MEYSKQYISHFTNPLGVGEMQHPDSVAEVKHEGGGCFDTIKLMMQFNDNKVSDIKFQARACSGTIAACSALVELVKGRNIDDCYRITPEDLIEHLGGIPDKKRHSVELAVEAVHNALSKHTTSDRK